MRGIESDFGRDGALGRRHRADIDPGAVEAAPIVPARLGEGIEIAVGHLGRDGGETAAGGGAVEQQRIIAVRIARRPEGPGTLSGGDLSECRGGGGLAAARRRDHCPVVRCDRHSKRPADIAGPGGDAGGRNGQR